MQHNQAKREAYHAEVASMSMGQICNGKEPKSKDCECFDCLEDVRADLAYSLKLDMGMTEKEILEYMNPQTMPELFKA